MDEEAPKPIISQSSPSQSHDPENENQKDSEHMQPEEVKVPRRPGRPPLRGKPKGREIVKVTTTGFSKQEQLEAQRVKNKQKGMAREENNLEGFIRIVDYLKKIECDETSLHNKMNPYNLMTPSCFWFTISAEYFSFDFFCGKNTHDLALDFLKKAQKTQITLPLRVIKPQKVETELEFQTEQLINSSSLVTDKLLSLIPLPLQTMPENVQKSTHLTTIAQDDLFRSSTRAIVFNYIKKKLSTNQKWAASLQPRLECVKDISPKELSFKILQLQEDFKHEHLDVAPQLYYRQLNRKKKDPSKPSNPKKKKSKSKSKSKNKNRNRNRRKQKQQDEIFNESESQDKKQNENQIKEEDEENQQDEHQMKDENEEQQKQGEHQESGSQGEKEDKQQQNGMDEENQENIVKDENENEDEEIDEEGKQSNKENLDDNKADDSLLFFKKVYDQDDLLLDAILHLPIDYVISILQSSINPPQLPEIQRQFLPVPRNDPLQLIYQIHPEEQKFLEYMKERQEKIYYDKNTHSEDIIEEKEREVQVEDAKCQVCTDGDYTDDNLIVFCSMCNISLHQRCVGLTKVPSDNWVCEVCAAFGPAGINVPCPLCNVKGGALKRTSIHISNPLFRESNPSFHQFSKKCPNFKHKEQYVSKKIGGEDEPYYDYFTKSTYPSQEPVCHFVWVHYVCAIWVPECYFQQKNATINIKGVQNIDKKRFKQKCLICQQTRGGACVKCDNEKCTKYYHPQCARKKKVYMEQLNLDKLRYLIFCEAHEPLKVKRKIEVKRKKARDQIVKFCRGIEKYVQTYKIATLNFKLSKVGVQNTVDMSKIEKKQKIPSVEKVTVKIQRNSDEDFIKLVIQALTKQNQIIVKISKLSQGRFKVDEVIKPSKREMRKSLTKVNQFWANFKNGETADNNLKRYNNIMKENYALKEKIQNFINFGNVNEDAGKQNKKGRKVGRKKRQIQTVIDEQGGIFCVCRKPYQGQTDMFECEVCNEWYHHECIGFIGSEQDAQSLIFHCMKCLKFESTEQKRALMEKCSKFFSQDSLFLNYRPPTPSLQSEQQSRKLSVEQSHEEHGQDRKNPQAIKQQIISQNSNKDDQKLSINMKKPFIIEGPINRNLEDSQKNMMVLSNNDKKEEEEQAMKDENQQFQEKQKEIEIVQESIKMVEEANNKIDEQQNNINIPEDNNVEIDGNRQQIGLNEAASKIPSINSQILESGNNQTPFFRHASVEIQSKQVQNGSNIEVNRQAVGQILTFSQHQVHRFLKQQKQQQNQQQQPMDEQKNDNIPS